MISPWLVLGSCVIFFGLLFLIAAWVERRAAAGVQVADHPAVYALSLSVYLTAWTYFGSVGKAATSGPLFFTFYLGPTLVMLLGWVFLRKLVRLKNAYAVSSIADFISLRYGKSQGVAALVTLIALCGIVPYIGLQLKAIVHAFEMITFAHTVPPPLSHEQVGFLVTLALIAFTLMFGVRRVTATKRHPGVVVAMAAAGVFKLIAFAAAGLFAVYGLHHGFGEVFRLAAALPAVESLRAADAPGAMTTWLVYLGLSMSAFMFLPRQFHVAVVENYRPRHLRTAMWLLPLYMAVFAVFVLPIALSGLLAGYPAQAADMFILRLPLAAGRPALTLLIYLGGVATATSMIVICAMTNATMASNHWVMPLLEKVKAFTPLKRYLLGWRWLTVIGLLLGSLWFEQQIAVYFGLVEIGMIAFAAIAQFAPALLGGLGWKSGNRRGALAGMGAGFLLWIYTLIVPALARGGVIAESVLQDGPWGLAWLRPEHLGGVAGLDPLAHAVFWSLGCNLALYVAVSLLTEQDPEERIVAEDFAAVPTAARPFAGPAEVPLAPKERSLSELFGQYLPPAQARAAATDCLSPFGEAGRTAISFGELTELYRRVERRLAGSIGAANAVGALRRSALITPEEDATLKRTYTEIIADLRVDPAELRRRVDYYREQERLLGEHSMALEERVRERDRVIEERRRAESALQRSEEKYRALFENSGTALIFIEADMTISMCNKRFEAQMGYARAEIEGKLKWTHFVDRPEDLERMKEYHLRRRESGPAGREAVPGTYEARLRSRTGEIRDMVISVSLLPGGEQSLAALLDISDRKRAEESLRDSQKRLADLIDFLPDPTFAVDRDRRLIIWNRAAELFTGVPASEMLGKGDYEYALPFYGVRRPVLIDLVFEPSEEVKRLYPQIKAEDGIWTGENYTRSLQKGEAYLLGKAAALYDASGRLIGAIETVRDITERKRADQEIRESNEALEKRVEARTEQWAAVNEALKKEIGERRQAEEALKYRAEFEKIIASISTTFINQSTAQLDQGIQAALHRIGEFVGTGHNCVAVFDGDSASPRITNDWLSPEAWSLARSAAAGPLPELKWLKAQLARLKPVVVPSLKRLPPEAATEQACLGARGIRSSVFIPFAFGGRLKGFVDFGVIGREREWPEDTVALLRTTAESIANALQKKWAEETKNQLEVQLRQAQRLESIGHLAAGIAHEINTPIQFVGDNTRFLQESVGSLISLGGALKKLLAAGADGAAEREEAARTLSAADLDYLETEIPRAFQETHEGIQRVSSIVKAMKEFSHPGQKEKTLTDLNHGIENTVLVARNEWKYVADLDLELDPHLPAIWCVGGDINQVILNLIVNAAHAIGEKVGAGSGGKGRITIRSRAAEDGVEIRVRDTGTGIPEANRSRVFDPFFTTKEVGKGTGQGLSLAYNLIVKKHGGRITFETELGQGTEFIVWLPMAKSETVG